MPACLFCENANLTKEHIWPAWMVKLFPETHYNANFRRDHEGSVALDKHWSKNDITHTAGVVCADCNGGWMSDTENTTIPVLKPIIELPSGLRRLTMPHQSVIAQWAVLRSMVFDGARATSIYYSRQECAAFARAAQHIPLQNTSVWLALLPDTGEPLGVHARIHSRVNGDRTIGFKVFNCVVGRLAFQIFHWKGLTGPKLISEKRPGHVIDLKQLTQPVWQNATVRVWPKPTALKNWPPRQTLTVTTLVPFLQRFML
jgi:hypothetical protein